MTEAADKKEQPAEKRKAFIYALSEPDTGAVRYVGKTCDLKRRFWDHLDARFNNRNCKWLRSLRKRGLRPVMDVLEEFDDHDGRWEESERFYIAYFRFLGMRLTNQESGGSSGKLMGMDVRERMSIAAKGRKFSPLAIQRSKEARRTPECRERIAAAKRGKKRSPEAIEKHRAKMLGHSVSEETRRKLSAANKGHPVHPEQREKLRQAALAQHARRRALLTG